PGVLRVEAHDPGPQIIGSCVGLGKIVGPPDQKIGQTQSATRASRRSRGAGQRAIEDKVSILLETGDGIVLHADKIEPESHWMLASDYVHVVGHLKGVDIEVPRRAGPTERIETACYAHEQEIRHRAVHVDAKQRRVDRNIRGSAVVAPAVESEVKRVQ